MVGPIKKRMNARKGGIPVKKIVILVVIVVLFASFGAIRGNIQSENGGASVLKTITVTPETAEVALDGFQQFTATVYDRDNRPMAGVLISWRSIKPSVGTISPRTATTGPDGTATATLTALAEGSTRITANNNAVYDVASVTVTSATETETEESSVTRALPSRSQAAGSPITVSLDVNVGSATYYALDEVVPTGWTITNASRGGNYISDPGHVKWVVIVDATDTRLTYTVAIPADAAGDCTFGGTYGMEGRSEKSTGGGTVVTVSDYDPYDADHDRVISMDELESAIGDGKEGIYSKMDLWATIKRWEAGGY